MRPGIKFYLGYYYHLHLYL